MHFNRFEYYSKYASLTLCLLVKWIGSSHPITRKFFVITNNINIYNWIIIESQGKIY